MAYQYKGATNSDVFLGFDPGKVLCSVIDADVAKTHNMTYYKIVYEFIIRWDGWKLKLVDKGFREKDGENADGTPAYVPIKNKDGTISSQPAMLDGSGKLLTEAEIQSGQLSVLEFVIHRSLPFSALNL